MLHPELQAEVARRRTFAIISHPDAGKTTLTEKLLLYGGAIRQAGSVKARKTARHATSDWMEIEKQRGISVTSSAMQFDYNGYRINILDTPGHQDFSEDTYRTLVAADSAVMLLSLIHILDARGRAQNAPADEMRQVHLRCPSIAERGSARGGRARTARSASARETSQRGWLTCAACPHGSCLR